MTGCKEAAIRAIQGAHITIRGALTSVAGNCLRGTQYGRHSVQAAGAGSTIVLQRPCGLQEVDCDASHGGTVTVVDQHPNPQEDAEEKVGVEQVE